MGLGLENPVHLAMLAIVVLLVFGPKRLPEVGRSVGRGIREFKNALTGETEADRTADVTADAERPGE